MGTFVFRNWVVGISGFITTILLLASLTRDLKKSYESVGQASQEVGTKLIEESYLSANMNPPENVVDDLIVYEGITKKEYYEKLEEQKTKKKQTTLMISIPIQPQQREKQW